MGTLLLRSHCFQNSFSFHATGIIISAGFDKVYVENLDVSVSGRPDKIAVINYAYCQYSKMKSVPQVFIRNKVCQSSNFLN